MSGLKQTLQLLFIGTILLSSCQIEKRIHRKGFHVQSNLSFRKNKQNLTKSEEVDTSPILASKEEGMTPLIINKKQNEVYELGAGEAMDSPNQSYKALQNKKRRTMNTKKAVKTDEVKRANKTEKKKEKKPKAEKSPKRKLAIGLGVGLILMAVLAAIAFPALSTVAASIALVGIFLLDAFVSWGVYKYHKPERPKLAATSGILRAIYTAVLGVAIGFQFAGNVSMFNHIWGIGLIVFGFHLITLGVMYNNEGGKKWVNYLIKGLLIAAGVGYVISYVGVLIIPNPASFMAAMEAIFILPMVLGEMLYALWMIVKGGKQ